MDNRWKLMRTTLKDIALTDLFIRGERPDGEWLDRIVAAAEAEPTATQQIEHIRRELEAHGPVHLA